MRLFDYALSGNCYKIRLLLAQLEKSYERVEVDLLVDGGRPDVLLDLNVHGGRVPVLELDDGSVLVESNAIVWHLAQGTRLLPDDDRSRVEVLRWMFSEQNAIEPNIATARLWQTLLRDPDRYGAGAIEQRRNAGRAALDALDRHLEGRPFAVGDAYTVADIALYAYAHVADEAGIDVEPYRRVVAWFERVRSRPLHIPMVS